MAPLEASCPHPPPGSFPAFRSGGLVRPPGARDSAGWQVGSGGPEASTRGDTPLPRPAQSYKLQHGRRRPNSPQTRVSAEKSARSWRGTPEPAGVPRRPPGPPPQGRHSRRGGWRGVDAARRGCGSREERRLLEGRGGQRRARHRGARRRALTASWWAHCGARPGAAGGGGRARGAAATSLQERAAELLARAG